MIGWYKDIRYILKTESEVWLAYLYGQQFNNIPHLDQGNRRIQGALPSLCRHCVFLLRNLSFRQTAELNKKTDFLIFSCTSNQMASLEETASILKASGRQIVEISHSGLLHTRTQKLRYIPFSLTALDVVKTFVLLARYGPSLYKELKKNHPARVRRHLDHFLNVYSWLVYFQRVIKNTMPDFVVTANDHNPSNRSLLAVAHHLGVKTVYMQHASISPLFPALRVDYAFLDGKYALDTYLKCENNKPPTHSDAPMPKVALTGQKKYIERKRDIGTKTVGVAFNALDDSDAAVRFVETLSKAGIQILARWHPGQPDRHTRKYVTELEAMPGVQLSDPKVESVSSFLAKVLFLVSGNSSIHLEAALAGVYPIYYELTESPNPDYYGYVNNGLAALARSADEVLKMVASADPPFRNEIDAVRYYSATYLTDWEGSEGALVARCLDSAYSGCPPPVRYLSLLDN